MLKQNYTTAIDPRTINPVTNAIEFETVKILNKGYHWLYVVFLSGQLSYFMLICTCVSFVLFYMKIFFLFGMFAICDTAPLKDKF